MAISISCAIPYTSSLFKAVPGNACYFAGVLGIINLKGENNEDSIHEDF
jgi:hypothetical protein